MRLSLLVACLFLTRSSHSFAYADVVVLLKDGSHFKADRIEQNTSSGNFVAVTERPGITLERKLRPAEVMSVLDGGTGKEMKSLAERSQQKQTMGCALLSGAGEAPTAELSQNSPCPVCESQNSPRQESYPGRIIGFRSDPLSAYSNSVARAFPNGVPLSEIEFSLELMHAEKARDVLVPEIENESQPPLPGGMEPLPPKPAIVPSTRTTDRRVDGVLAHARPINSQGRGDWDALLIEVQAVDVLGRTIPVNGTIQATLWGQRQQLVRAVGEHLTAEPGDLTKIAEWTRSLDATTRTVVAASGTSTSAGQFILPLPQPLADHDLTVAPFGDLHIQVLVPGQGVFEATESKIPLRRFSPIRARNIVERGTVNLPGEGTSDGTTRHGALKFDRPTSGPDRRVFTVEP